MSWGEFCQHNKVPAIYHSCSVSDLKQHKQHVATFLMRPFSMILIGETGRGKSYYMYCLIKGLLEKGYPRWDVRLIPALQLDDRVDEDYKKYGSARYFLDCLCDDRFLFIDDFGIERSRERAERNYYHLLDNRLANKKPTVITTNLLEEEILSIYGARIDSRLKQAMKLVFVGEDLRTFQH